LRPSLLMSVPTSRQAFAFLAPLRGRTSVFITPSRRRNSKVARFLLGSLAASRERTVLFDTSSFYGVNMQALTESLPRDFLQQSILIEPPDGQPLEDSLADLLTMKPRAIVIDDLNSLHYLLSASAQRSGTHQLFNYLRLLAFDAKLFNTFVFLTVYRAEGDPSTGKATKRSLPAAGDLQIFTDERAGNMTFRCDQAKGWPNHQFSAPLYF